MKSLRKQVNQEPNILLRDRKVTPLVSNVPVYTITVIKTPRQDTIWERGKVLLLNSHRREYHTKEVLGSNLKKQQLLYHVDTSRDSLNARHTAALVRFVNDGWNQDFFFLLQRADWNIQNLRCFNDFPLISKHRLCVKGTVVDIWADGTLSTLASTRGFISL